MDLNGILKKMVLVSIDTAKTMLDEYGAIVPFGLRAFADSDDMKINSPAEENSKANWDEMITAVVAELKEFVATENIAATALVTMLEVGDVNAIGLQIETDKRATLFVYTYSKVDDEWVINEPIQTEHILETVYPH